VAGTHFALRSGSSGIGQSDRWHPQRDELRPGVLRIRLGFVPEMITTRALKTYDKMLMATKWPSFQILDGNCKFCYFLLPLQIKLTPYYRYEDSIVFILL
jgi:hypothetical protein